MADEKQNVVSTKNIRAPYDAPRVVIYGALMELTRAIGKTSNLDGGAKKGMTRSQ